MGDPCLTRPNVPPPPGVKLFSPTTMIILPWTLNVLHDLLYPYGAGSVYPIIKFCAFREKNIDF